MKTVAIISSQAFSLVNFRGRLIVDLVAQGDQVYALAPDYSADFRVQVTELGAIPVDFELARTGMSPWRDLFDMARLTVLLRKLKPDVTLSYFIKPVIYGTLAAWAARVPHRVAMIEGLGYVFTATGNKLSWPRVLLREGVSLLYRMALSRAHRVIFLNKDDIFDFLKQGLVDLPKICHLEGIGVDLDYWSVAVPVSSPVTFLLAARLLREKGILEFAQAATQVKRLRPQTRFILLGALDPNPGSLDIGQVQRLVDDGIVEWPGHVNLKPWMAQASVYVLPSYREGLPRSTQEAMAMGRAVITTDVPGCRETVMDGVNGFLVPVRNAVALAQAMLKFVNHPELIEVMGLQSRRMAKERFDVRKINPQLLKVLDSGRAHPETAPISPEPDHAVGYSAGTDIEEVGTERVVVSVSVVSHGQMGLVKLLLQDIALHCRNESLELLLTLNFDEFLPFDPNGFFFPVTVIRNEKPKGFSANHNHAFGIARGDYFCVVNPAIRFDISPFSVLLACFQNPHIGVVAPLVFGPSGEIEDSKITFPTPKKILKKVFAKTPENDNFPGLDLIHPDWVGGVFMLFRRSVFEMIKGFDERYYLYYEDVDICARLKLSSFQTVVCPSSPIVHRAQRSSHRNIKYLRWHVASMTRFFTSPVYRQLRRLRWL